MNRLFLLLGLCVLFSCHDVQEDILLEKEASNNGLLTRSITPYVSPVFDWWDTTSISLPGISNPVTLPWYSGASTQIPYYLLADYKPEDGWEMIYNYCIDTPPGEVNKSYIIFYDKFTGILRVFYYNNNDVVTANTTFWRLEITKPTSLLNAVGPISLPISERIDNPVVYVTNLTSVPSKSIARGWNCFDVELAYDDKLALGDAHFNIGVYNMIEGKINLTGDINLKTDGTIVTHVSSQYPGWVGSASKVAGRGAKSFLEKMLAKTSLKSSIVNIVSGGFSSLISTGAKYFLGSLVGKDDKSFDSNVQLTTTGKVGLAGDFEILTTPNILPLSNNSMPGCVKGSNDSFLPSYDHSLGVWNVEKLPLLYESQDFLWAFSGRYFKYHKDNRYLCHKERIYYFHWDSLKVKINPDVLECIDRYTVGIWCIYKFPTNEPDKYEPSKLKNSEGQFTYGVKGDRTYCYTDSVGVVRDGSIIAAGRIPRPILSIRGFVVCTGTGAIYLTESQYNKMKKYGIWGEENDIDRERLIDPSFLHREGTFLYQVIVTLYPKAPYNTIPIVSMRTYKAEINSNGEPNSEMPLWQPKIDNEIITVPF